MSKLRKILFAVAAFGGVATAVGAGTFASFTASTSNAASTFQTGTLVLSNQKNTATACLSTGGGTTDTNANAACDQPFAVTLAKPGDSANVDITLVNSGSINATALTAYATSACVNSNSGTYNGTGDLCAQMQMYVQEYTSAANRTANTTTGGNCWYGGGTATACAFSATKTVGGFPLVGSAVALGAMNTGATRYLRVYLSFPSTADNTFQGRLATFGMTWAIAQ
jgi:hypothetical protein